MDVVAILDDDDREDGEIVDDFEEISDCSIPSVGKCDNALLRAISLSSISDSDVVDHNEGAKPGQGCLPDHYFLEPEDRRFITHHRKRKRKRRTHSSKQRRYSPQTPDELVVQSSSEEEAQQVDRDMLRKLKEAVHIDNHGEHHKSLRSRLKAMINTVPSSESDDEEIETLRTLALLSNSKLDDKNGDEIEADDNDKPEPELVDILDDRELLELRSAALKSAVLKKHLERKKRKEHVDIAEVNKENTISNDATTENDNNNEEIADIKLPPEPISTISAPIHIQQQNGDSHKDVSIEEDVDIMRAMLLASMSNKITAKPIPTLTQPRKQLVANNRKHVKTKAPNPKFTLAPVKPLIININNDSDSESDVKSPTKKPAEDPISQSVTAFLKLQRQRFEAKEINAKRTESSKLTNGIDSKAKVQSGNPPSNGLVVNKVASEITKPPSNVSKEVSDVSKDVSGVRLLPEAQQKEYELLKRKLLVAKRRQLARLKEMRMARSVKMGEIAAAAKRDVKPHTLKETLADLQFRENGRLRVKGKYGGLATLLRLVGGASEERQRCEGRMRRLLDDLTAAKMEVNEAHRRFTQLVQKLIREKETIDAKYSKTDNTPTNISVTIPILTTPLVTSAPTTPIFTVTIPIVKRPLVTSTPKKDPTPEGTLKISSIISETRAVVQHTIVPPMVTIVPPMAREIKVVEEINPVQEMEPINPFVNQDSETFPKVDMHGSLKYISPLDNRSSKSDPLGTICPYELFGDCKDASCTFVHCGRS